EIRYAQTLIALINAHAYPSSVKAVDDTTRAHDNYGEIMSIRRRKREWCSARTFKEKQHKKCRTIVCQHRPERGPVRMRHCRTILKPSNFSWARCCSTMTLSSASMQF